jgi:hypothetical protein
MGKHVRTDHCRDWGWQLWQNDNGTFPNEQVVHALLMDIRAELKELNRTMRVLQCPNFLEIPRALKRIGRNTAKKRKPRAVGKPKLRVVR